MCSDIHNQVKRWPDGAGWQHDVRATHLVFDLFIYLALTNDAQTIYTIYYYICRMLCVCSPVPSIRGVAYINNNRKMRSSSMRHVV